MSFKDAHKTYLFFLTVTLLFYSNSVKNDYAIDDILVTDNPVVKRGISALPEIFTTSYYSSQETRFGYRPMAKASFAIEHSLFGENPHISHFINLLLYWLSICLLFKMLNELMGPSHVLFSTITCLLFLIHPLHSEVVCNLKNRETILSFIGSMGAIISYGKYIHREKIQYLISGALFLLFAYISKEDSMVFLFLIPFSLHYFKNAGYRQLFRIIGSFLLPFGVLLLLVISFRIGLDERREYEYFENPLYFDSTIWNRLSMGFYTLAYYIKLLIAPYPLLVYYGYSHVSIQNWSNWIVQLSAVFTVAILAYCMLQYKTRSHLVYGILFFLAGISMFLNTVIPVTGIIAERYAFHSSLGFCIAISALLFNLFNTKINAPLPRSYRSIITNNKLILTSLAVIFTVSFLIVSSRNPDWKDTYTLARADILNAPNSVKIHDLLADESLKKYNNQNITESEKEFLANQAIHHYKTSNKIFPQTSVLNNIGMALAGAHKNYDEAIPYFNQALDMDSTLPHAYYNLAVCFLRKGNIGDAEMNFKKAIQYDSTHMQAYFELTGMYINTNRIEMAIQLNRSGIDKGLKYADLYLNLGDLYLIKNDSINGLFYYEQSLKIRPNNKKLSLMLENYYRKRGNRQKSGLYEKMARASE